MCVSVCMSNNQVFVTGSSIECQTKLINILYVQCATRLKRIEIDLIDN